MKSKILIYSDWFPPAFKAGGPIQSIYQLTQHLKEEYEVYVITTTQDLNDSIENQLSEKNQFITFNGIQVNYLESSHRSITQVKRILDSINPDFIFFNGLFNKYFHRHLLFLLFIRFNARFIISIRGMLKPSALNQKEHKKKLYLWMLRRLVNNKKVTFHCTSEGEKSDLIINFGAKQNSSVLTNIPFRSLNKTEKQKAKKLKLVYAARIHPIKNLRFLIELLKQVKSEVELTIIGVIDDEKYWLECKDQINHLPENVNLKILGDIEHQELMSVLSDFDLYILPTLGENFGHSIFEALSSGLPVIISDQTPWRNLKSLKVGFDIPLSDKSSFVYAIEKFAGMRNDEYKEWSMNAREYAVDFYDSQDYLNEYKTLFSDDLRVGVVAPIPFERYKGGISNFAESFMSYASEFKEDKIDFKLINTCVIPRTNESTGKFKYINLKNYTLFIVHAFKQIRKENIKILHIHTSVGKSILKDSISALLFKRILGTKNILHLHVGEVNQVEIKGILKKMNEWILGKAYDSVLVLSPQLKEYFEPIFNDRIFMIRNFYNPISIEAEQKKTDDTITITFIGSISRSKGILDLFEALSAIKERNWQLSIAGEFINTDFKKVVMESQLYNSIKNNVKFLGYAYEDHKVKLLKNNDILVLPSYAEGMPISLLEAISYGNAIVTTNVGANQTHFSNICNLLKPGDVKGLTLELSRLINDKELLNKRKKEARKLSHRFTFDAFKKQITPIYKTI